MSLTSSAQVLVVEGDTLYCFTPAEARQIAKWRVELDGTIEQLSLCDDALMVMDSALTDERRISESLREEIMVRADLEEECRADIESLQEAVKLQKRKSTGVMIGAGVIVVLMTLVAIR